MKIKRGFTLVELLVVIGVIGVLAAVALVVIDPSKKNRQARDAARKATLAQIAGGLSNGFVSNNAYPAVLADLVPGELKFLPAKPGGGDFSYQSHNGSGGSCTTEQKNCVAAALYDIYESPKVACGGGRSFWAWTSSSGRLGKVCSATQPSPNDLPVDDL